MSTDGKNKIIQALAKFDDPFIPREDDWNTLEDSQILSKDSIELHIDAEISQPEIVSATDTPMKAELEVRKRKLSMEEHAI